MWQESCCWEKRKYPRQCRGSRWFTLDRVFYLEYAVQHVVDEVFIQVNEMHEKENFLKNMILEFENMGVVVNLNLDLLTLGRSERNVFTTWSSIM